MAALPKHIIRVAHVAGSIAVFQAAAVIVIASVLLAEQSSCSNVDNVSLAPSQLFTHQLKVHYFQDAGCEYNGVLQDGIMSASEMRVWLIITLSFSAAWMLASICLFVVSDERATEYFGMVAYAWSAATAAVVVVDATMGVLLGLDYGTLNRRLASMETVDGAAYGVDVLRMGALLLAGLALKGGVLFVANAGYAVTLVVAGTTARRLALVSQHSVHTQGPLHAFTTHKRTSDPWPRPEQFDSPFARGTQVNQAFVDSENASLPSWREPPNDYNNRSFDRSNSWHHSRTGPVGGRPFSYLEEPRGRQDPAPSPAAVPPWRRDPWDPPPPVPAPDYSPLGGKRLKSALKPAM